MPRAARGQPEPLPVDPVASARTAGLRYTSDTGPGIRRRRAPSGDFTYVRPDGRPLRDQVELQRIRHLAIPPAWEDVWISPSPQGHLQATGRDARGRKQYRYHPEWRRVRDETKYGRMIAFGQALPRIRARVGDDLSRPGLSREKVVATVVRLLDSTYIRVGNEEYARQNRSFGLTTMHEEHVNVSGSTLHFEFTGKSGKRHSVDVRDRRVASIVRRCQDLPGHHLFQYVDSDGTRRNVESADVNEYLEEVSGQPFTAKDFRTWAGTVLAAWALQELGEFASKAQAKRNLTAAVERVAKHLGNTSTISRKSYIHPEVISAHLDGSLVDNLGRRAEETLADDLDGLRPDEAAVLAFLRRRLADARSAPAA